MSIVQQPALAPRWVLNGFPKSGLHLLMLMVQPLADPIEKHAIFDLPWTGTFYGNGWLRDRLPVPNVAYRTSMLKPGEFVLSHCGYDNDLEAFLRLFGASKVFLYRDLRDVAVSQAFHVLSDDDDSHVHQDKDLYRALGSFDKTLEAVIVGLGKYPGLIERWEDYAPWLDEEWVFKTTFEDLIQNPYGTAEKILRYGFGRPYAIYDKTIPFFDDAIKAASHLMVSHGKMTEKSATFREGKVGNWRNHFNDHHKSLFKETDNGWLTRLGYEQTNDW